GDDTVLAQDALDHTPAVLCEKIGLPAQQPQRFRVECFGPQGRPAHGTGRLRQVEGDELIGVEPFNERIDGERGESDLPIAAIHAEERGTWRHRPGADDDAGVDSNRPALSQPPERAEPDQQDQCGDCFSTHEAFPTTASTTGTSSARSTTI